MTTRIGDQHREYLVKKHKYTIPVGKEIRPGVSVDVHKIVVLFSKDQAISIREAYYLIIMEGLRSFGFFEKAKGVKKK